MDLDAALDHINRAYTHCSKEDVRTDEMRLALRTILAAFPEAKPLLIEYWHATEYQPELDKGRWAFKNARCVPILRGIDKAVGRRWTIDGYVWDD